MTEEEYFIKHYPDVCYNGKPLSPYWDLFWDGVEFGERQSEKKIKELEKENAELKELHIAIAEDKDMAKESYRRALKRSIETEKQLIKAKNYLSKILSLFDGKKTGVFADVEQFLKEVEK